jgi:hypothetical protein
MEETSGLKDQNATELRPYGNTIREMSNVILRVTDPKVKKINVKKSTSNMRESNHIIA